MLGRHLIISTFLLLTGLTFGQKTDSTILDIDAKYKNIRDSIKALKTATVDLTGDGRSDGDAISYSKDSTLKLIVVTYYGETGKNVIEYYFDNGKVFFAYEKKYTYNRPIYWDKKKAKENNDTEVFDEKKTKMEQDRYYFRDEKIILWLDNKNKMGDLTLGTNSLIGQGLIAHAYLIKDKFKK